MIKNIIKTIRTIYINFGYRHKCSKSYWVIYLLFNLPVCSFYHDVLQRDDMWMYEMDKHFLINLQKLEKDFFNNRKYIQRS